MNGDNYTDVDLAELVANHHMAKADASVVVVPADARGDCGSVQLDGSGKLASFEEKQEQFHERRYVHCHETFQFHNGLRAVSSGTKPRLPSGRSDKSSRDRTWLLSEQDFLQLAEWMIGGFAEQQIRLLACTTVLITRSTGLGDASAIPRIGSRSRGCYCVRKEISI
jgi:hypothetical protein